MMLESNYETCFWVGAKRIDPEVDGNEAEKVGSKQIWNKKWKKNKKQNQGQHKHWFHNDDLIAVDSFFCSFCQSQYCSLNLI